MEDVKEKNKKLFLISGLIILVLIITCTILIVALSNKNKVKEIKNEDIEKPEVKDEVVIYEEPESVKEPEIIKDTKVDIIDINSPSRPYMVVVNNTPVAVKVQEGLNRAYIVYEVPVEFNFSRLLAVFKDIDDNLVIGTIRSARHNFIDYAFENDAIFCCWGWSFIAERELRGGITDYLQGLWGYPFFRGENPEGLALEHTAYGAMSYFKDKANTNGFRTTTLNKSLLKYDTDDVNVSNSNVAKIANKIVIPYGEPSSTTSFIYDKNSKMYVRYSNGNVCIDYHSKEQVTTKNIIVQKINYTMAEGNYYWDLKTVGEGEGYFITNGYAVPITWKKDDRASKTKYSYATGVKIDGKDVSGEEITVSDGRTYIEIQTTSQPLTIE